MSVSLKITTLRPQSIKKTLDNVTKDIEREAIEETKVAMLAIHSSAIKVIQKRSPGTPGVRYNPRRNVTVSKEGESPNTDTGRLISSIGFNFQLSATGHATAVVGTNLVYGRYLEFGTDKGQMKARPWLSTAWAEHRDKLLKKYSMEIKKAIKKNGI